MLHDKVRLTALAGCALGILAVAGCGARGPVDTPPPAEAAPRAEAGPGPELLGAPPAEAAPADGLLGGPAEPGAAPTAMVSDNPDLRTWRRPDGTLVTAMAPIANPEHHVVRYRPHAVAAPARRTRAAAPAPAIQAAARPAPRAQAAASPVPYPTAQPAPKPVVAAAPAPLKPVAIDKPVIVAKAPAVAPIAASVAEAVPGKPLTPVQQLQAAVAPAATKGAVMASGASLATGQAGQVTLSLPATLGEMIRTEADKLGLGKAARKTSAYAELQGEGYDITPNGRQTAVVTPGEPATFAWNVKPTPAAKGALKTQFGVALNGAKPAQDFALGAIAKQVAPAREQAKAATQGFQRALSDLATMETVDLPGLGKIPGRSLLGGVLVLLALLILVAISRGTSTSGAKAERRRKFRPLTGYGPHAMDLDAPRATEGGHVNPAVAAAGGAVAGAAVASAASHGGHAPAPKEHDPFASPLPAAADPGHDGPRPFPEAHAPEPPVAAAHVDPGPGPGHAAPAGPRELEPLH